MSILRSGSTGAAVRQMQRWINLVSDSKIATDGIFGAGTAAALRNFQRANGLVPDGIFGRNTFLVLRSAMLNRYCQGKPLGTIVCPADKLGKGAKQLTLRTDAANMYNAMYAEAKSMGISVTTAGGLRRLQDAEGAGRSKTSLHFAAIAFDLALDSMCTDPTKDAFVCTLDANRNWTVWARCTNTAAPNAPKQPIIIENPVTYINRRGAGQKIEGLFVNFTELAKKHGFTGIPPHANYLTSKHITSLECWHFDLRNTVLMPNFSTFGEEITSIWSFAEYAQHEALFSRRNLIWAQSWFG